MKVYYWSHFRWIYPVRWVGMIPSMVAVEKALTVNEILNEDELPKRNGSLKTRSGVVKWENLRHKSRLDPLNQE